MNIENIKKLTPYQDINDLLADWTEGIKSILGENVVGLLGRGMSMNEGICVNIGQYLVV